MSDSGDEVIRKRVERIRANAEHSLVALDKISRAFQDIGKNIPDGFTPEET